MYHLMLKDYTVLDLTDEKGYLCGKILGDLGADVIKVEKPGGDTGRNTGPFYHDFPDPEKSLNWFAYNTNKRSITLDIDSVDGKTIVLKLVEKADLIIESFSPGYLDELGLGYFAISKVNPKLVMTSITPFGQSGPYKNFKASDLIVMAIGGAVYAMGDPDRPPVRISVDQAFSQAASDAAVGSLIALYHAEKSGEGQHVDVSAQESVLTTVAEIACFWDINKVFKKRSGPLAVSLVREDIVSRHTWPCRDGFVMYEVLGGLLGAKFNRALVEWAESEGLSDELIKNIEWETFDYAEATQEVFRRINTFFEMFFMTHTKEELFNGAMKKRIILYPVADIQDIIEDEQLKARQFWQNVPHSELNDVICYPGAFSKSYGADLSIRRRPPLVGEHNEEIYRGLLGFSGQDLLLLKQNHVI
jgi:crotonobetainyl-CoA:carnitine CoA-transferase CaiB-like acyl-CoA transferase